VATKRLAKRAERVYKGGPACKDLDNDYAAPTACTACWTTLQRLIHFQWEQKTPSKGWWTAEDRAYCRIHYGD
jgi:hypothetical protein